VCAPTAARSTLWRHPVVAPLLMLAGAVPVFRKQDRVSPARNLDTFKRCREVLARGGTVLLFPEGTSHNHPHGLPLKTGAARMALETIARHGVADLRIVAVGLNYEAKDKFGSRVLAIISKPLDPGPEAARYAERPREAVRLLTARMSDALGAVTVSHPTWEEARLVERGVGLILVGTVLNFVPYRLPGWLFARLSRTLDEPATHKLLAALLFFPLAWLAEAALVWAWFGVWWGVGIGLLAPASSYAALLWVEGRPHPPPAVKVEIVAALRTERARLREEIARHLEPRPRGPISDPLEDASRPF